MRRRAQITNTENKMHRTHATYESLENLIISEKEDPNRLN